MRWADDGIFLAGRPHGETSVIAGIFTRGHGRAPGLIKGGRSRRLRPLLQTGNGLKVEWRARLDDQLGVYTVELAEPVAARVLDDNLALSGITALVSLLQVLPERDPHPKLFDAAQDCLANGWRAGLSCLDDPIRIAIAGRIGVWPRPVMLRRDGAQGRSRLCITPLRASRNARSRRALSSQVVTTARVSHLSSR